MTDDTRAEWVTLVRQAPGWLSDHRGEAPGGIDLRAVRARVAETKERPAMPLWEGYAEVADYPRKTTGTRRPGQVSTGPKMGATFAWIAKERAPATVVEFGAAFGVSGMYWLAGIEAGGGGHLHSFEANDAWADVAEENHRAISARGTLHRGIFEERAPEVLTPGSVDLAFVDGIHTSAFILAQFEILRRYMAPGGLILFDDLGFSDDMRAGWERIAASPAVHAAGEIKGQVGIVELPR